MKWDSTSEPWVLREKLFHFFLVTCKNDYSVISCVLHHLDYSVYSFLPKELIPAINERVGFVDKEHRALSLSEDALYLLGCPAHIFTHQVLSSYFY